MIVLTVYSKGFSCKCYKMNLKYEIDSAEYIFRGIPINKKQIDSKMIYKFSVDKVWKGEKSDTIVIKTGLGGQDCGMVFEIGKTYIVYSKNGQTSYCRRNSLIDSTYDDLKLDYKLTDYFSSAFINQEKILNDKESEYLNRQFNKLPNHYDFKDKAIAFTSSTMVITKSEWIKTNWEHDNPSVELLVLTEQEKKETGFDSVLVTWSKFKITDKMRNRILKQLNKVYA